MQLRVYCTIKSLCVTSLNILSPNLKVYVCYGTWYNIFKPAVCVNFSASITGSELKKETLKYE
jgi:hypothetical protein